MSLFHLSYILSYSLDSLLFHFCSLLSISCLISLSLYFHNLFSIVLFITICLLDPVSINIFPFYNCLSFLMILISSVPSIHSYLHISYVNQIVLSVYLSYSLHHHHSLQSYYLFIMILIDVC